jgi:hypothetical protein
MIDDVIEVGESRARERAAKDRTRMTGMAISRTEAGRSALGAFGYGFPFRRDARRQVAVLWLIVWGGGCLTVYATEKRALAMILFAYLQGAERR